MPPKLTILAFSALSADDKLLTFFSFSRKTGINKSCILSPLETVCMKCQNLFSEKKKKKKKKKKIRNFKVFQYVIY